MGESGANDERKRKACQRRGVSSARLNRAACLLSACLVALDEANMTLPNELPGMPDGADLGFVYFGAAEAVREAIADIREVMRGA